MVCGTSVFGNHCGFQGHRKHASGQASDYILSDKFVQLDPFRCDTDQEDFKRTPNLRSSGFRPTLSSSSAPKKLDMVATVT